MFLQYHQLHWKAVVQKQQVKLPQVKQWQENQIMRHRLAEAVARAGGMERAIASVQSVTWTRLGAA